MYCHVVNTYYYDVVTVAHVLWTESWCRLICISNLYIVVTGSISGSNVEPAMVFKAEHDVVWISWDWVLVCVVPQARTMLILVQGFCSTLIH